MRATRLVLALVLLALTVQFDTAQAARRIYTLKGLKHNGGNSAQRPAAKDAEKPFDEMIKDRVAIPGLFTFYQDTVNNTMLMAIRKDQYDVLYLCNETMSKSEGTYYHNSSMMNAFPFYFQRVGKKVLMLEKNLNFRADTSSTINRAVKRGLTDHLYASTKVESKPDTAGTILIDPAGLFVRDASNASYFLGQVGQTGFSFDRENSYFETVKSFPHNTEVDVRLHYRSSKPLGSDLLSNPYTFFHTYHYSLSTLPETDFVPRYADDRVGHFLTVFEDYTHLDAEHPQTHLVNRWNLKKKNPDARISEPVEPIVFWVENTIPPEFKDAFAEGIEFWNPAFEKIGFRSAIIAKQMPDTADWDPADVRFNVVRGMFVPGAGYAAGPSRANPFTGQIYDADIRVSLDFIRYMFSNMQNYIGPLSFDGTPQSSRPTLEELQAELGPRHKMEMCSYQQEAAREASFGLTYLLSAAGDMANKDSLTREYVHAYIVEVVAHEVGHCLGFRHNFKGSTVYTMDQWNNAEFTKEHGTTGSIMDYTPPNIAGPEKKQGEFYSSVPGPYDYWSIEYAYAELGGKTPEEDMAKLKEIASRSPEPTLAFATDEDAFGSSAKGIDPLVSAFDYGPDPLGYAQHKVKLTRELWNNALKKFEMPGESYQKMYDAFQFGWRSYTESAALAPKYIGGIYHRRDHVGDPGGKVPFEVVPAAEQRRAMKFLTDYIFSPTEFNIPADIHNRLQPERLPDLSFSVYSVSQVDYPFHQAVANVYSIALNKLYHPLTVGRLLNNTVRFAAGEEKYTMYDMFTDVRKAVWTEAEKPANVNSFRRQLQLQHLEKIVSIYLSTPATYPTDARSLAANDLDLIQSAATRAMNAGGVDEMSKVHFKEVVRQIEAAKNAQRNYNTTGFSFGG